MDLKATPSPFTVPMSGVHTGGPSQPHTTQQLAAIVQGKLNAAEAERAALLASIAAKAAEAETREYSYATSSYQEAGAIGVLVTSLTDVEARIAYYTAALAGLAGTPFVSLSDRVAALEGA
jgi:hypothetical protein